MLRYHTVRRMKCPFSPSAHPPTHPLTLLVMRGMLPLLPCPTGIIVEMQCGVGLDFQSSLDCLTTVQPEVFDLCTTK